MINREESGDRSPLSGDVDLKFLGPALLLVFLCFFFLTDSIIAFAFAFLPLLSHMPFGFRLLKFLTFYPQLFCNFPAVSVQMLVTNVILASLVPSALLCLILNTFSFDPSVFLGTICDPLLSPVAY